MKYQWQFTTDDENPEGYYQKLVNMNLPEVLSLEEAAERLNELERDNINLERQIGVLTMYLKIAKEQK